MIPPAPAPDPTLQIWTLAVAAVAAVAAIVAAIVTSKAAAKREKSAWLRAEQISAYEEFTAAVWDGIDEIAGGAVQKAYDSPGFSGLEEAYEAVSSHTSKLNAALRRIQVVGGDSVVKLASDYRALWIIRSPLAVPLSGAATTPAHRQRGFYIRVFSARMDELALAMRQDLGLHKSDNASQSTAGKDGLKLPDLTFSNAALGEANATLREWKVRTWPLHEEPPVGPSYCIAGKPWEALPLDHGVLREPLVAMMRKPKGMPWFLAIDSTLTAHQVDLLERDAATLVTSHGRFPMTSFGGHGWVPGEFPDEKLYWWTKREAPPAN